MLVVGSLNFLLLARARMRAFIYYNGLDICVAAFEGGHDAGPFGGPAHENGPCSPFLPIGSVSILSGLSNQSNWTKLSSFSLDTTLYGNCCP